MFFSKRLFTTFVLLTSLISCGKKDISKIEKPTELKGYVEYLKKIKENPDGNNYYAGYKEVELRKMINKQRSANQSTISNSFNDPKYSTSAAQSATFTERGPQNASGRTRAFIVDLELLPFKLAYISWLRKSVRPIKSNAGSGFSFFFTINIKIYNILL